jgi:hypothetical protein
VFEETFLSSLDTRNTIFGRFPASSPKLFHVFDKGPKATSEVTKISYMVIGMSTSSPNKKRKLIAATTKSCELIYIRPRIHTNLVSSNIKCIRSKKSS